MYVKIRRHQHTRVHAHCGFVRGPLIDCYINSFAYIQRVCLSRCTCACVCLRVLCTRTCVSCLFEAIGVAPELYLLNPNLLLTLSYFPEHLVSVSPSLISMSTFLCILCLPELLCSDPVLPTYKHPVLVSLSLVSISWYLVPNTQNAIVTVPVLSFELLRCHIRHRWHMGSPNPTPDPVLPT